MGKRPDIESPASSYYHNHDIHPRPPPPPPFTRRPWFPWLVPLIFVVDVVVFGATMYENDCPSYYSKCLFEKYLGRFSFLPFHKNPLLGPSTSTLQRLGGLRLELVQRGEWWRLFSCLWLHAGAVHLIANMLSLLFIGVHLEEEFGFLRIGPLYVLSGFGGSLLSCLHFLSLKRNSVVSVGASGALFGLLGAMLSELITNWTIYANKCTALSTLLVIITLNLVVGFIPGVDNSAHIGGFMSGFLLGFVLLIRPQYGYVSNKYLPAGRPTDTRKSKYKCCQCFFLVLALLLLIFGFTYGLLRLLGPPSVRERINYGWAYDF